MSSNVVLANWGASYSCKLLTKLKILNLLVDLLNFLKFFKSLNFPNWPYTSKISSRFDCQSNSIANEIPQDFWNESRNSFTEIVSVKSSANFKVSESSKDQTSDQVFTIMPRTPSN